MAAAKPSHLVITVHGIRTFGQWSSRLAAMVRARSADTVVVPYVYGYFSALAFALPPARWLAVRYFRQRLEQVCETYPDARIDIVAHSFGTHLAGWALRRMRAGHPARIHTVLLAGSVLKRTFRWDALLRDRVRRVVNECGTRDVPLILSQLCILFTGMAGRTGFSGMMTGREFCNRFHEGGHDLYFSDAFMREYWVPLLTSDDAPEAIDVRRSPGPIGGVVMWATQNLEPIKIVAYALAVAVPIWGYYTLVESREQHRKMAIARQLTAAALSQGQRPEDLPLRLLLAVASYQYAPTPEAEALLRRAIVEVAPADTRLDHEYVGAIAFAEGGRPIAVPAAEAGLGLRVVEAGTPALRVAHGYLGGFVSFSGDGEWLVVADDTIRVLELASGEEMVRLRPPTASACGAAVRDVALSADRTRLAAAGSDGAFVVWDLETERELMGFDVGIPFDPDVDTMRVACVEVVRGVSFTPDGAYVATAIPDAQVVVWRARTGRKASTLHEDASTVAFSDDGDLLVTGSPDGTIRVWDWMRRLEVARGRSRGGITAMRFTADGKELLTAGDDGTARVWDFADVAGLYEYRRYREDEAGEPFPRAWMPEPLKEVLRIEHQDAVTAIAASPDGNWIATLAGGAVYRWPRIGELAPAAPASLVAEACRRVTRNLTPEEWQRHLGTEPYRAICPNLR